MAKGKYEQWLTEDGLLRIQGWARDGLTDEQIAHNIGISRKTLYEWQNRFSDFRDALKRNKEVVDIMVENALLKSALGYEVEETVQEINNGKKIIKKTTRWVLPSVTAQIFWLKNRKPEQWRDKPKEYAAQMQIQDDPLSKAFKELEDELQ